MYVCGVAGECCHVGHAGVHVCCPYGVSHCLLLLRHGQVALAVLLPDGCAPAVVEQELGKVQVFLLAGGQVEPCHGHLGYLVPGHHACLPCLWAHLATSHVGIAAGYVEELAFARGLPVGHGALHHVPQVIELVAQVLLLHPAAVAGPVVGVGGVLRACGV